MIFERNRNLADTLLTCHYRCCYSSSPPLKLTTWRRPHYTPIENFRLSIRHGGPSQQWWNSYCYSISCYCISTLLAFCGHCRSCRLSATLRWTPLMFVVCRKDMVCMNEEDRKLQIAMGAHMKQLIGQYSCIIFRHILFVTFLQIWRIRNTNTKKITCRKFRLIGLTLHCTVAQLHLN